MIRSFRHAGLRRFWIRDDARRLPPRHVARIRRILSLLAAADSPSDMAAPGFRLHPLRGRPGAWSVRVSANWRIVFRVAQGHVRDVDLKDYL